jgi:transposase-like protein
MTTRTTSHTRARERFLAELEKTGNVSAAADVGGVHRSTFYDWRKADPDFAAAWGTAQEKVTDRLEAAAIQRAGEGIEEVIGISKDGKPVYGTRRSDRLLEFLLKGRRRTVYGDRREVTGKDGAPLLPKPVSEMSDEELREARERLATLAGR